MSGTNTQHKTVVRAPGGLFIAGTRITLYDVMDYLVADWPPHLIRHWLNLTEHQMAEVMQYIDEHRAGLEKGYQRVLQQAAAVRRYWEARHQEQGKQTAATLPTLGQGAARAKLQAWKARLEQAC